MGGKRVDLTGQRFTRLLVVSRARTSASGWFWNVVCDCGNTRQVRTARLLSGEQKSCGCLRAERLTTHLKANATQTVDGLRACRKCGRVLSVEEFSRSSKTVSGLQTRCRRCALDYAWYRTCGITREQADELLREQGGKCAVCPATTDLHLDHDHANSKPRGFLCGKHNRALGLLQDSLLTILSLAEYLKRTTT
jgi:hypothetical protein